MRRSRASGRAVVLVSATWLHLAGAAWAQAPDGAASPPPGAERAAPSESTPAAEFRRYLDRGVDLYQKASYEEAAVSFWNAYYIRADPKILFNIAQCYRKSGQKEQAISLFQRYQKEEPSSPLTLEAAMLENSLRSQIAAAQDTEARRHSERLTQNNQILYEKLGTVMAENERLLALEKQRRPPIYRRPALWIGLGVGAASVIALGVGLALAQPRPRPEAALGSRSVSVLGE